MAHIHEDARLRERLSAHRDHVQRMIDRLDEVDCGNLLAELVKGYEVLAGLCADLAVEHLREHVTEVDDAPARLRGAEELEPVLRAAWGVSR